MSNAVPEKPWSHITVDFITKLLLAQEYNTILIVCNRITKIAHFVSTTERTLMEGVARLFQDNVWKLHGLPKSIITDRGAQFAVEIIRELNQMLGINIKLSTAYHLQTDSQMERMNQELEQYLRMFIDHHQEQWPDWLAMAEFAYNNKVQTSTKVLPFKTNNGQDLCMGFEIRKKGKFERAEEFVKRMKEVHEEAEVVLRKSQEEIRKYMNKKRSEPKEYRVDDWLLLSTKDLRFQIKKRCSEKLMEQFVGPYKIKRIILTNIIKLELPSTMKIHLVLQLYYRPVVTYCMVYYYTKRMILARLLANEGLAIYVVL